MNIMRKKSVQLMVTVLLAAGIILAGTFAWFSFSQNALNVFDGFTNPDVNIHDDYEYGDVNKDVYVENNGSRPLYVRVRFDEYMDIDGRVLVGGTKDEVKSWKPHSYMGTAVDNCGEAPHEYYDWVMGGMTGDPQGGMKYYLPAPFANRARFDKGGVQTNQPTAVTYSDNGDGKAAAVYGADATYTTTETGKAAYERVNTLLYTKAADGSPADTQLMTDLKALYVTLDAATAGPARRTAQEAIDNFMELNGLGYWDKVYKVSDVGGITSPGVAGTDYTIEFIPMKRSQVTGKIHTMAQWIAAGTPTGDFWIIDTDGWAYWGNILLPNQATGLLLSEVMLNPDNSPAGRWYYGINAQLQAVTYDDIAKFGATDGTGGGGLTDRGMMVLQAASGNYVYDREAGKIGANDPIYTFVNNKDNSYRLMLTTGANTLTYGPTFIYTGTTPPANAGDIYGNGTASGDESYRIGAKFKKDIPFGKQGVEFTIVEASKNPSSPIIESKIDNGKHYLKLEYQKMDDKGITTTETAWLAVGADRKFDKLTDAVSPATGKVSAGDDILVWTNTEAPGMGGADRTVEDASSSYKIGDTFTKDGMEWVIVGIDTKANSATIDQTLIISKNVIGKADTTTKALATAELAKYEKGGSEESKMATILAADDTIVPKLLTIDEALGYFATNASMIATDGAAPTPATTKWWLADGIVGVNGAPGATVDPTTDTGVRVAFWMNSAKVQEMLYPTTSVTPPATDTAPSVTTKTVSVATAGAAAGDETVTIDLGSGASIATGITSIAVNGTDITLGTDYTVTGNTITLKQTYLNGLAKGTVEHTVTFTATSAATGTFNIVVG